MMMVVMMMMMMMIYRPSWLWRFQTQRCVVSPAADPYPFIGSHYPQQLQTNHQLKNYMQDLELEVQRVNHSLSSQSLNDADK